MAEEQKVRGPDLTDPFLQHEVLHTSLVLAETFDRQVADHRYVQGGPQLRAAAEDISQRLHAFYQLVGGLDYGAGPA